MRNQNFLNADSIDCLNCGSKKIRKISYSEGRICRCINCRLQWASLNGETNTSTSKTGSASYYMTYESIGKPENYKPYKDFFNFVRVALPNKKLNILDIGCGSGRFISECLNNGYDVFGVEKDASLKRIIPAMIRDRITFKPIEEIEDFEKRFDMITFWDSFEHMKNAFFILNKIRTFLEPGGYVYLRVNNNNDVYNWFSLLSLSLFPSVGKIIYKKCFSFPKHLWNFSGTALRQMLRRSGWEVVRYDISETPAQRLTPNLLLRCFFNTAYFVNGMIGGGKIANVYIRIPAEIAKSTKQDGEYD